MSRVFKNRRGKGVMDLSCPSSMPGNTLLVADPSTYGDSRSLREEDVAMEGPKPTTTVTETTTVLAESAVSAAQVAPGHTLCTEIPTDDDSDGYVVSLPTGEQDFPQSFPSLPSLDAIRFDSNIMYDFTVSPAILKELFVNSVSDQPISLVIHKIGDTLAVDGGLDEVLLQDLQSSSRDSPPLLPVLIGTHSAVDTASTVPVMFLGDDPTLPEPVFLLTNFPTSDQQYPVSILHRNLQLQRDAELQLQLSSLVSERSSSPAVSLSPHLPSPTLSPSSPSSTSTALTLYRLNDGGIHCQLGDVTIASSSTPPSHSPGIMPRMSRTFSASTLSRITALNMWLDSSLSPVSHDDTSNASPLIPSLPLGKSVPSTMLSLLHFLKRHCNSENATYWIVTDPRDGSVKLFSFASQAPSAAFTLLPSFRKPVAQLCLRAADRLYGKRLSPNTSHPTTFPTVPDAVDVASDSFDRKLCSHLYSRALELLSLPGEWLTWVHIHGRLASVDLDGHLYPVSPKHGYTTSSCDYQVWLQLEALPSRSSVPLPSTTVDLLDNEQVLLDAALAALPRWLRCRHTLQKTLHAAVCDSSPGLVSDGTSVIPLEAIRTEAQCRSSIGHALLLIAKLDLLQGHLGRALQLCGVVNGMLEIPFHPESTWVLGCHCFNEVRAEVYAVVGRVYMELASQLQSCRSAVDALHILSIHQSELTDTLPTISPGRTSDVVGDAQWLSVPTALLMVPIAAPTSSAVAALLAARDSSESSSISCKCHHPQPPTLFGSLADLPGYSPSAALPVDVESCYNSAIQVFIRVLRTSAGPPSAASHSTSPWFTHVIPWLQYAYSGVGEHFLRNGRFTKAAQHFSQGRQLFASLNLAESSAILSLQAARLSCPPHSPSDDSLTSDPGSCSNPIGIAALLSSLHTRLATYRSVLASLESAHCQSVDGIRSLGEATDTVGDLYMLLARVHGSISEQCMSLLSMVRVAPVLTSQQLSVLSSWYTVVSVENGVVEAGSRHSIPRRTLVSEQSWLSAVDDHEMRAAEFCRSAIDAFTRCNHVTKMRECLLLAGQLNGDRLIRLVQNGRADRFPLLCDVLTQLYSRLSATSSEVDTISLNAVRCEVNAWTAIGEAALSSVVQTAETTKRVIAVASNALQALLKCVPVLRAQCVNTCDDAWTDLYTGLLWALKHLTKLSPDKTLYKHVYTIALTNPKGRTSAADLLADILECVVPSKAAL